MTGLIKRIRRNLENAGVNAGDRILVAVSGGPDSVALLHLLSELSRDFPFQIRAAHLNHSFRGVEADEDAEFVKTEAKRIGIPCKVVKKEISGLAKLLKQSKQEAARNVRYRFLEATATRWKCRWIATGHQADDQAETFLMRLIRGAGMRGLSGIPAKRDRIIRPLLDSTREEITAYLRLRKITFREDRSNRLPVCLRNRVRMELLPLLRSYNPNISRTLGREIEILTAEDREGDMRNRNILPEITRRENSGKIFLLLDRFLRHPLPEQRRIVRILISDVKGDLTKIHFDHIERILRLAVSGQTGKRVQFPDRVEVEKVYGELVFSRKKIAGAPERFGIPVSVPCDLSLDQLGLSLRFSLMRRPLRAVPGKNEIWFDWDRIAPPLMVRNRLPGDRIYPVRLKGSGKKLQDLFVDLKIPRSSRDQIPLLSDSDRVLWVIGIERDSRSTVSPGTRNILSIRAK